MTLFSHFGIKSFRASRNRRRPARLTPAPAIVETLEDRTLLAAPTLLTPTPGYTTDSTPTFDWSDVVDADEYHLWVNDLNTGESGVIFEPNLLTSDFTPMAELTVGHSYIWTAAGIDGGVYDDWAAHQTFTVRPEAPELTGPTELITQSLLLDRTPTLTWSAVAGADHYDVAVNNLTTGEEQVIRNTNVVGTELVSPIELEVGHNYIWSVRAVAETGVASEWAAHKVFTAIPEAPELLSPVDVTNDTTPEFTWSPVEGADHYVIWVNDLTTGTSAVVYETNVVGESFTPALPLDAEHQYLWTMRAVTDTGYGGEWAEHRQFFVDNADTSIGTPKLLGPFLHTVDRVPEFRWTSVPGAESYELVVTNLTTGEYGVILQSGVATNRFTPSPSTPLDPDNVYTYSVRAVDGDGNHGSYAPAGTFTVDDLVDLHFTGTGAFGGDVDAAEVSVTIVLPDGSGGFDIIELRGQEGISSALGLGSNFARFDAEMNVTMDDFDYATEATFSGGTITLRQDEIENNGDVIDELRPGVPGSGTNSAEAALGFWRYFDLTPPAPADDPQVEMAFRDVVIELPSGTVPLTDSHMSDFFDNDWTVSQGFIDTYIGPDTGEGNRVDATGTALETAAGFTTTAHYQRGPFHASVVDVHFSKVLDLADLGFEAGSFMMISGDVRLTFINPVGYLTH